MGARDDQLRTFGVSEAFARSDFCASGGSGALKPDVGLAGSPSTRSEAFDLAGLRRRYVVRAPSHLAHESLFLHLAAELAQRLLELLGVLDDYSHDPSRIQAGEIGLLC